MSPSAPPRTCLHVQPLRMVPRGPCQAIKSAKHAVILNRMKHVHLSKMGQFRNNTGPPRPMFNPISRCCSSVVKVCLNACARLALIYFRVGSRFVQIWFRCGSSLIHLCLVEVWVKRGFRIGPSNHTVLSKLNKPLPKLRVQRRRVKANKDKENMAYCG